MNSGGNPRDSRHLLRFSAVILTTDEWMPHPGRGTVGRQKCFVHCVFYFSGQRVGNSKLSIELPIDGSIDMSLNVAGLTPAIRVTTAH